MAQPASIRIALALALVGVVVLGAIIVFSEPASPHTRSCAPSSVYGTQCVTVSANGLTVTAVEAQFSTLADFFGQDRWTFETTTYRCDPRGRTKSQCAPDTTTYGSLHRPNPANAASTACSAASSTPVGDCSGSLRFPVPHAFAQARWLCVEVAVQVKGKWVDNGTPLTAGDRS